jgi:murein L,D-transpeptidase YcbB/YkuD
MQYFNGIAPLPRLRHGHRFKIRLFAALLLCGALHPAPALAQPASIEPAALKAAAKGSDVKRLYRATHWHLVWTPAASATLEEALRKRAKHGLDRIDFLPSGLSLLNASDQDVAQTKAALEYATALARGRIDPNTLHEVYTLPRPDPDLVAGLISAIRTKNLDGWLESLAPQDDAYRSLSHAYLEARQHTDNSHISADGAAPIRPGESDARIPAIVQQLAADDYLSQSAVTAGSMVYTRQAVDAVSQLQKDYGIAVDGIVGADTLKVLNFGADDRARALAVGLERRRWLSRTVPATRIDVNVAAAQLRYYRDGKLVNERKVIVGQPGKETPPLLSPIYRLVANPTWTIPKSIQRSELAHVSSAYLEEHNMVRRGGWIVQQSGPGNALGLIKFDMLNRQAIYLHDTSARSLFGRSQRHLSHGCVRVDDAAGLADLIARDEGVTERWNSAQASGKQTFVALPHKIPVRLLYHNVFQADDGAISFRTDPYGWNAPIGAALGFNGSSARNAVAQNVDVGP